MIVRYQAGQSSQMLKWHCNHTKGMKFYLQTGYLLNLSHVDGGTLGERKEKQEGRGRLAASRAAPTLLGWQWWLSASAARAAYFSFLLQVGLPGSTYWDSRRQPKTIIQFHAEVKTGPYQHKKDDLSPKPPLRFMAATSNNLFPIFLFTHNDTK